MQELPTSISITLFDEVFLTKLPTSFPHTSGLVSSGRFWFQGYFNTNFSIKVFDS